MIRNSFLSVIINDSHMDSTRVAYPSIKHYYQNNGEQAVTKNRGLRVAKGDSIAFFDSDALWMPDKRKVQISAFCKYPCFDIITGHVEEFFSSDLQNIENHNNSRCFDPLSGYIPTARLVKRQVFETVRVFHEEYRVGEFISWFSYVMGILIDLVARRRIHGENISIFY